LLHPNNRTARRVLLERQNRAGVSDPVAYWNAAAASFDDEADHGLRDPSVRAAWAALLEPFLPPAPARIADLGCGTGSLSCLLAEQGHLVSGLDLAPAMIDHAREKAAQLSVSVTFAVGDALSPPWQDRRFEVVLCRHLLWALADPAAAVREWMRILRPGGRLLLIEGQWTTGAGMPASAIVDLLAAAGRGAAVTPLDDPTLWGHPIADERYLIASGRTDEDPVPS
jgi:SAM-dependent methyltransferase